MWSVAGTSNLADESVHRIGIFRLEGRTSRSRINSVGVDAVLYLAVHKLGGRHDSYDASDDVTD